jgi:hypothetical protein
MLCQLLFLKLERLRGGLELRDDSGAKLTAGLLGGVNCRLTK